MLGLGLGDRPVGWGLSVNAGVMASAEECSRIYLGASEKDAAVGGPCESERVSIDGQFSDAGPAASVPEADTIGGA